MREPRLRLMADLQILAIRQDVTRVSTFTLGIEQSRSRDWLVTRVAVRSQRRLGRRSAVQVVDWQNVTGLTPSALSLPGQGVAQLLHQFEDQRPIAVADALRDLPAKRRTEVIHALDDERHERPV